MAGTVLLVMDRSDSAVVQAGQPSAQMGAWLLPIADGSSANQTAADFAASNSVPVGTIARVVDLSVTPITIAAFRLDSSWTAVTV